MAATALAMIAAALPAAATPDDPVGEVLAAFAAACSFEIGGLTLIASALEF